jgi:DNA-binding SARP family transcriptional activator/tetratricopeptide (TPR) repeat protein
MMVDIISVTKSESLPCLQHMPIRTVASPPLLSMTMLGPLTARDADGNDLLPRVRKTRAVLAILALAAPRPVPRSQLTALLWSRREAAQARGSLRQATHELRMALGPVGGMLRTEAAYLALSDDGLQVDARQILLATPAQPDALILWQGQMLGDLVGLDPAFDRWMGEQLQDLLQRVRAIGEVVLAEAGGHDATRAAADRLLAIDAAHEGAWRALIRVHVERGDCAAAVAAYERCRTALSARREVAPSAETTALVAALRAQPALPQVSDGTVRSLRRRAARSRIRLGVASLRSGATAGTAELAAGLAEELIIALSRFSGLACVPCACGQLEPDVDFLLDGSVQCSGDRFRVLLRLTDRREGGEVVWAERFDSDLTELFTLPDLLARTAAARLEPRLWLWEGERSGTDGPEPRTAQDLLRLAIPAVYRLDRRRFMAAGGLLDQSIALDPDNASAHAWAAQWHIFAVGQGWASTPATHMQRARGLAERAILLDPEDGRGLSLAGHVRVFMDRRPEEALSLHERALETNPSLPLSWCLSGLAHAYAGDCDAAIERIRHAQKLSPFDPLYYFFEMALAVAYMLRGDHVSAAEASKRAVTLNSGFSSSFKALVASLGHLGHREAAADARARLLTLEPGFTFEQAMHRVPIAAPRGRALYADGLRLGGLA